MSVIFGSMFAQSFYMRFLHIDGAVNTTLFVNKNALAMTYMGDEVLPESPISPFAINPISLSADYTDSIAAFEATINGTTIDKAKYLLDFNSIRTVAWSTECQHNSFTGYGSGPCSTAPVNAQTVFDTSEQTYLY
jgi:hypothetical protein